MISIILYRLMFWPVFLLVMPYYAIRMIRRGGYRTDFKYRFGLFKKLPKRKFGKRRIWIQAVSVGEVKALEKLITILSKTDLYEIVLTTTSSTGYALAKELYAKKILFVGLFPFDFWAFSWLAWRRIFPHVAILMESEIWPEHIWQAKNRNVPVILVNARISDKAVIRYKMLGKLTEPILDEISYVLSPDAMSTNRCREIGIPPTRIKTVGNVKFDNEIPEMSQQEKEKIKRSLGFEGEDLVLLGSSTWHGEEQILLKALRKCKNIDKRWRLLLVPRHAERRNKVADMLMQSRYSWHQRSAGDANSIVDICLADTTGELQTLTAVSDLAFIGKSLSPNGGGQSPLDAACCGVPIVYGSKMTNFAEICSSLEASRCAIKVSDPERAIAAIAGLAKDSKKREEISQNVKKWHKNNCGASQFVAKKIQEIAFATK